MNINNQISFLNTTVVIGIADQNRSLTNIIGSGIIVPDKKIITAYHVYPTEDRKSGDILMALAMTVGGRVSITVDLSTLKHDSNLDIMMFDTINWDKKLSVPKFAKRSANYTEEVIGFGYPPDYLKNRPPENFQIAIRAIRTSIVTQHRDTCETQFPFIKGMSGGPVFDRSKELCGMILRNNSTGLMQEVLREDENGVTYSYNEFIRFGSFLKVEAIKKFIS